LRPPPRRYRGSERGWRPCGAGRHHRAPQKECKSAFAICSRIFERCCVRPYGFSRRFLPRFGLGSDAGKGALQAHCRPNSGLHLLLIQRVPRKGAELEYSQRFMNDWYTLTKLVPPVNESEGQSEVTLECACSDVPRHVARQTKALTGLAGCVSVAQIRESGLRVEASNAGRRIYWLPW
jgi:hypothetical protein